MQGGFTFRLSDAEGNGNVRIKHLSRRASFINFARPGEAPSRNGRTIPPERGFFLDLRTLAAALTSQSHTLKSLAKHLKTTTQKAEFEDFGRPIDAEMIAYAIQDVQVTRECHQKLMVEYDKHGLSSGTPAHRIYSEASLGKTYLEAMKITPWRKTQRDFPNDILGAIMSSYYGGRAEVHRRREVRTLYCDFASMYPTVCTLQGLWQFVIATGADWQDATAETQDFLASCELESFKDPAIWKQLPTLVRVKPDGDIFPVRTQYGRDAIATIGLNYLSSDQAFWFPLADCVASKLLTGKTPKLERAIRFAPRAIQRKLSAVAIAGNQAYRIDPARDDFYRRLIDLRRAVKTAAKAQITPDEAERLDAEQLALKILANATSYGIFIEINPEDLDQQELITVHTGDAALRSQSDKMEEPGKYFHPLLATLITGAARLMLAITERLALDNGLDWAFCDTDSMAFALPPGMEDDETAVQSFEPRVKEICAWFESLNPYEVKGSILEFEDQNFARLPIPNRPRLKALYCYAVSAKRYALFNKDPSDQLIIRKASAHGLGHLYPPYSDDDPDNPDRASGVLLWQENLWRDIVAAALRGHAQPIPFAAQGRLNVPAASRYSATTPHILGWFRKYNEDRPYSEQVRPFNFLTWFHPKRPEEHFWEPENEESEIWDRRARAPKPVAPFDRDLAKAADHARDRETWEPVPKAWLRTYAEALRIYHIHPENKFLGGRHTESGPLKRRHVFATAAEYIGKEGDRWEEDSHFGADEDSAITYGLTSADRAKMIEAIRHAVRAEKVGVKRLAKQARLADRVVTRIMAGDAGISDEEILRMHRAAGELLVGKRAEDQRIDEVLEWAKAQPRTWLAAKLGYDLSNLGKVLAGRIRPRRVLERMRQLRQVTTAEASKAKTVTL
jgi:hypothetical protein